MHHRPRRRWVIQRILASLVVLSFAAGCGPKDVRWSYAPDTPHRLAPPKRVALLAEPEIRTLTGAVAAGLEFHGYAVSVWEPEERSAPAAKPSGAGPAPPGAELVFELSARYERQPVPGTRVRVRPWVSVDVTHGQPKEWYILVTDARLDLKAPGTGDVLGSVMVRFDKPQEDIQKVAKKLTDGLAEIRKGKRPKRD